MPSDCELSGERADWPLLLPTASLPDDDEPEIIDLPELALRRAAVGTVWANQSEDLNARLIVFEIGQGIAEHVDDEADVLLVGISGEGAVNIDGRPSFMWPGTALLIAKGARRSIQASLGRFSYLACSHRTA